MSRMNPRRWLLVIAFLTALYVSGICLTALDGIWNVPQQLHSLILTALSVATVVAARAELAARSDRLASAERADHAAALGRQLDALRREMPTQQLRPAVPVQSAEITEIGQRIARRLNGYDGNVRH